LRRRAGAAARLAVGALAIPAARLASRRPADRLAAAVGEMLMLGFFGTTRASLSARLLAAQVASGQVGGVFLVLHNIGSRDDVAGLVRLFRGRGATPLLAIDHEGGIVQRLTAAHGFTTVPTAREVAATMTPAQARALYATAGRELAAFGFNVNLAPVVDLDDPANPAIGHFGRAYGTDPEQVARYAAAFVDGFSEAGVICAAKHFPGHGYSRGDSHDGPADISAVWSEAELVPFQRLIAGGRAPMVMGGHLRADQLVTDGLPTTFSPAVTTRLLRERLGFAGVVVTDDLDMDAVSRTMDRRRAVIRAIVAGNDLLMIKNLYGFDPLLPRKVVTWVRAAIADGTLSEQQILASAGRVRLLRQRLVGAAG
jgi:beta-N-acetylhexosaminidase